MIKVVYIAGSGRSGTTLLERMLGQIASFVTIGELRHLWRGNYEVDLCGCGRQLNACPFWQPLLAAIFTNKDAIDFKPVLALRNHVDRIRYLPYILTSHLPTPYQRRYEEYTDTIRQVYDHIHRQDENVLIVDSSKDISTLYLLAKLPFIDLRVVHMVRDSRAVAHSWQRKRIRPQVTDRVEYMPIYSPVYAACDWLYRNVFIECGKRLYSSYHLIRYEDLVQNPVTTLSELCTALGVTNVDLAFVDQFQVDILQPAHTVSGNPMRFYSGTLTLKMDLAWRQKMKTKDKWIVTGLTWLLLRHYYPLT